MGYALLKLIHLLGVVIWVGGMFFTLFCLRPAAQGLEPPLRVGLMQAVLGRFFSVVLVAGVATVFSGLAMVVRQGMLTRQTGAAFNMPMDWSVMGVLGLVMLAVFARVGLALYPRLKQAVAAQDWPAGGQVLARIRLWVALNLGLGVVIILTVVLGAMS